MARGLDATLLHEIIDGFIAERVTLPSERLLAALACASGTDDVEWVRAAFEARFRAAGHETTLFDSMPFSGSG